MAKGMAYHPETYWTEVADRIGQRGAGNVLAGDDSPFYRYKRKRFLEMLHTLTFKGRAVLELGSGPGGNLNEVWRRKPARLTGADISERMVQLATKNRQSPKIEIVKINGESLPFDDGSFDLVFSATVLQHNSDENMMRRILEEMCRVSNEHVVLFERIESTRKGDDLCVGRPVGTYADICRSQGFTLTSVDYINIQMSYLTSGAIRRVFNATNRREGQPLTAVATGLQRISLPITTQLDKVFRVRRDLARLIFTRQ